MNTALDARNTLRRLQAERLDAVEAGLGENALYMTDLDNDIEASRADLRRPRRDGDRHPARPAQRPAGRLNQQTVTHCCWPLELVTSTVRHFRGRGGMNVPRMSPLREHDRPSRVVVPLVCS